MWLCESETDFWQCLVVYVNLCECETDLHLEITCVHVRLHLMPVYNECCVIKLRNVRQIHNEQYV